jgi:serine/threonine protein kinase
LIGSRLGPYEITAQIGEGGMGLVYKAKDSQLGREVALKVLPEGLTQDAERLARFEREAKLLASLNHPNIAQIYGLETSGGSPALVMELVEGPTLADRLAGGGLSIDESLSIARQIAEALEEAHEKGIVHRDLKPQNVKASIEGKVKVLDFGLAKAMEPAGGASAGSGGAGGAAGGGTGAAVNLTYSPTLTSPAMGATVAGVILGTAAYMAPEQARGGMVDSRADIWAFGVVLFEMLSGEHLFAADTVPDTLARVLTREPDLAALPPETPAAVRRLVRRCLVRRPKDRLHSIADARLVLDDVLAGRLEEADAPTSSGQVSGLPLWRRSLPWIGGVALGIVIGVLAGGWRGRSPAVSEASAASIRTLVAAGVSTDPSVSPDGRTLAFDSVRDGVERIWIKDLSSGSESPLVTRESAYPAFSPDGTSVLYMGLNGDQAPDLYRTTLATRESRLVARGAVQGVWAPDGRSILFLRDYDSAVTNGGGELVESKLEGGSEKVLYRDERKRMNEPRWSPDGGHVALGLNGFQAGSGDRLGILDVATGKLEEYPLDPLGRPGSKIRGLAWVGPRRLAVLLLDMPENVAPWGRVASFDLASHRFESLLPIATVGWGLDRVGSGSLIVGVGSTDQSLLESSRDPAGRWQAPALVTEGPFRDRQPCYSPDGKWLYFSSNRSGNLDLWRLERSTGELQRLTDNEADDWDPALSSDGSQLLFSSNRSGRYEIWIAAADGSSPRQVTDFENVQNPTLTADGEWIVFVRQGASEKENGIWKIHPDGTEAVPVAIGAYLIPETSPDGRYAAFRGPGARRIVRLSDGTLLDTKLGDTDRYRWSVEEGRTYLWAIGLNDRGNDIRRYAFDPERGTVGPAEVVVSGERVKGAESLGVARDGSAVTFSNLANRRAQLVRIDGIQSTTN